MLELEKIPFTEVARLAKSRKSLTILPVGVVEEHGAHLPLGLDSFAAEVYAAAAAPDLEKAGTKSWWRRRSITASRARRSTFPARCHWSRKPCARWSSRSAVHWRAWVQPIGGAERPSRSASYESAGRGPGDAGRRKVAQVLLLDSPRSADDRRLLSRRRQTILPEPRPDLEGHGGESETSVALHGFPELVNRE